MIAKIVKGAGAKGIVDYILDREKGASLIDHDGVLVSDSGSIARSFIAQSKLNPRWGSSSDMSRSASQGRTCHA